MRAAAVKDVHGGKVEGLDGLIRKLQRLGDKKTLMKASRNALGKAMTPVQKAAKRKLGSNKSVITGLLRLSIGRRIRHYPTSGVVVAIVGPRTGFRRVGRRKVALKGLMGKMIKHGKVDKNTGKTRMRIPSKYAHLVEKGTRPHALGKGSRHPANVRGKEKPLQHGRMHRGAKAKRFMKPAWDENKDQALSILGREMGSSINQIGRS